MLCCLSPVVAPPAEITERVRCSTVLERSAGDVSACSLRIRPVALDHNRAEAVTLDEKLCKLRARLVELLRAVRRLSKEHKAHIAADGSEESVRL